MSLFASHPVKWQDKLNIDQVKLPKDASNRVKRLLVDLQAPISEIRYTSAFVDKPHFILTEDEIKCFRQVGIHIQDRGQYYNIP